VNAQRRARKRANHASGGNHSGLNHVFLRARARAAAEERGRRTPGPINCPVCRPNYKPPAGPPLPGWTDEVSKWRS